MSEKGENESICWGGRDARGKKKKCGRLNHVFLIEFDTRQCAMIRNVNGIWKCINLVSLLMLILSIRLGSKRQGKKCRNMKSLFESFSSIAAISLAFPRGSRSDCHYEVSRRSIWGNYRAILPKPSPPLLAGWRKAIRSLEEVCGRREMLGCGKRKKWGDYGRWIWMGLIPAKYVQFLHRSLALSRRKENAKEGGSLFRQEILV